jgi:hypothetical protein
MSAPGRGRPDYLATACDRQGLLDHALKLTVIDRFGGRVRILAVMRHTFATSTGAAIPPAAKLSTSELPTGIRQHVNSTLGDSAGKRQVTTRSVHRAPGLNRATSQAARRPNAPM